MSALIIGCISNIEDIQTVCSTAISFLITHHLVFTPSEEQFMKQLESEGKEAYSFDERRNYITDALLYLTGSEYTESRTKAFSTLSALSTNAS